LQTPRAAAHTERLEAAFITCDISEKLILIQKVKILAKQ
jgi:hypothetical protein